jgi:hypothetical protein
VTAIVNAWRNTLAALVAASAAVIACGTGTVPSRSPSTDQPVGKETPPGEALETPGPWAPSRALRLDRFALETAVGVALIGPAGEELGSSTRWTLAGGDTELRLEVRTWFSGAEAEVQCRTIAGDGAVESLSLGTPVWAAADDVYLTRGASCIHVNVTRSGRADLLGAAAVAAVLVRGD